MVKIIIQQCGRSSAWSNSQTDGVVIPLDCRALHYLGTTRESVSRKLSDFQRAGWIKVERSGIYVEELDELYKMVEM